ncbi:MAG: hypothetical protein ABI134_21250 [Byssovorax sp.]
MNRFVALARTGLLGFAAASIVISTGCGMDVGVGGTTGTGGHDSGAGGDCSGSGSTTAGSGGQPGTTTSNSSTGTGSTPVKCGGNTPFPMPACAADEYCDYSINNCGAFDNQGVCTKRPEACDKSLYPTCGCDGQIHGNECDAAAAGTDVNTNGCTPPPGQFSCGAHFCQSNTEYCERILSDVGGFPDDFTCKPLPAMCAPTLSCACLSGVACGDTCAPTNDGGLKVTCPGG